MDEKANQEMREALAPFPENLTSLNECCYNKTCLGGFQTLPDRLVDFVVTWPRAILQSKDKYCKECGYPERQKINNDELDNATDEHCNIAMDNGFKGFYTHHTWTCFFVIYFFIKSSNRIVQLYAYQLCKYN